MASPRVTGTWGGIGLDTLRVPQGVWDRTHTALVLAFLVTPLYLLGQLAPSGAQLDAAVATFLSAGTVGAATLFVYIHWRAAGGTLVAWLALPLAFAAAEGLVLVGLVIAAALLHVTALPTWARTRFTLSAALLALANGLVLVPYDAIAALPVALPLAVALTGAILLLATAAALVRSALRDKRLTIAVLSNRVAEMETDVREDRGRLHEIDSMVAGIASASRLIHDGEALSAEKRFDLEVMVQAEVERLQRLLKGRAEVDRRPVDLDETIGHLVVSHRARGRDIRWKPSGLHALGRADDVTEAVNVLLENAARHGSTDDIRIETEARDSRVEIAVTDDGPGIGPETRERLFEWCGRSADSPGQGIGLHVARQLMERLAGDLRLDDSSAVSGTRFVISLPAEPAEPTGRPGARRARAGGVTRWTPTSRAELRVVIVEDHTLFAESLELAFTVQGYDVRRVAVPDRVGAPGTLVASVVRFRPRVVLLDLDLGGFGDGVRLIEPIARSGANVVVVTGSTDRARWGEAIRHGARKVLSKSRPLNDVLATVRRLNSGLPVMDTAERQELLGLWLAERAETQSLHDRLERLTTRERAVLGHLMSGRVVRDIAHLGVVSEATVRTQVKSILAKLEVSSQLAAVGLASKVGWRSPAA